MAEAVESSSKADEEDQVGNVAEGKFIQGDGMME